MNKFFFFKYKLDINVNTVFSLYQNQFLANMNRQLRAYMYLTGCSYILPHSWSLSLQFRPLWFFISFAVSGACIINLLSWSFGITYLVVTFFYFKKIFSLLVAKVHYFKENFLLKGLKTVTTKHAVVVQSFQVLFAYNFLVLHLSNTLLLYLDHSSEENVVCWFKSSIVNDVNFVRFFERFL